MPEIKYEITEHLGVISETSRGWTREVNMISWNGREPKVDVRDQYRIKAIMYAQAGDLSRLDVVFRIN